jgi:hypothetical protein
LKMTTSLLNMVKEGLPKSMLSLGSHGVLNGFATVPSPQSWGTKKERSEANITWGVVSRDVRQGVPVAAGNLAEVAEECEALAPPLNVFVFLLFDAVI